MVGDIPTLRNPYRFIRHWIWRVANKPFPAGAHITRFSLYAHMQALGPKMPNRVGPRVLSISQSGKLGELARAAAVGGSQRRLSRREPPPPELSRCILRLHPFGSGLRAPRR